MKLIKNIESIVNSAPRGEKSATFRYQILLHADQLITNSISGQKFIAIATSLTKGYATEYDKHISFYKYCKRYNLSHMNDCDLCLKFTQLSHKTWRRIKFIRKSSLPLKIHEVTITENLLFELNEFLENCNDKSIVVFEAVKEEVNGNDIEFFVQQPNGQYIFYPIQAKKLDPSLTYKKIPYYHQTKSLLLYAQSNGGIPLYLLYNYVSKYDPTLSSFGCSIVDAHYLNHHYSYKYKKRNKRPTFDDLHITLTNGKIVASPWYELVCDDVGNSITSNVIKKGSSSSYKFYTKDEILKDEKWQRISHEDGLISSEYDFDKEPESFSPKYRIIINNKIEED